MLLKLLVIGVIWLEVNFVAGQNKDIYELEFWTRTPKLKNRRQADKPFFRNSDIGRRVKKTRGRTGEPLRSTRIKGDHKIRQDDGEDENLHPTKPPHDNKDYDESDDDYISAYSLKSSMEQLSKDLGRETNITVEVLGRTFEYNDIVILKMAEKTSAISKYFRVKEDKYIDEAPEKKIIFIVHAISTMGIQSLPCLTRRNGFRKLLNFYLDHLDHFDIYLIPLANPDGYIETFNNQHWIKNLAPQDPCRGVALDRNFDVAWGSVKAMGPCSQNYPGPLAFSEPESRAIRDVFHRYGHKVIAYINVHAGSYISKTFRGEAVLYPKGFTETQSDDDKYMDMKGEIDETMRNASFQRLAVTVDTLYHWYGKVSGTSVDYAATVFGIPYAMEFVMETYREDDIQEAALSAVWKRVIDAVFNFIHKRDTTETQKR